MLEKCLGQLITQAYVSTNTAAEQKPVKPHDKFQQPPSPSVEGGGGTPGYFPWDKAAGKWHGPFLST
jgi:hypothetical protein